MTPNQSAFPHLPVATCDASGAFCGFTQTSTGMSLRDYFAASAVQSVSAGIIAESYTDNLSAEGKLARAAFEIADAMLAARENSEAVLKMSLDKIVELAAQRDQLLAFVENWEREITDGGVLDKLEGWQREFAEEARAAIAKAKGNTA
jgi:hypothetical protein